MLINTNELQTLCLNKKAHEELTAQVINQLNEIADPLVRYAAANSLKKLFETATREAGAAAVAYCHEHQIGLDNTQFRHEGLTFSLDYKCDFDYAANDTNDKKEPAGYKTARAEILYYEKRLAAEKKNLEAAKAVIELAHPKMEPINPTWTMKFYMKEI